MHRSMQAAGLPLSAGAPISSEDLRHIEKALELDRNLSDSETDRLQSIVRNFLKRGADGEPLSAVRGRPREDVERLLFTKLVLFWIQVTDGIPFERKPVKRVKVQRGEDGILALIPYTKPEWHTARFYRFAGAVVAALPDEVRERLQKVQRDRIRSIAYRDPAVSFARIQEALDKADHGNRGETERAARWLFEVLADGPWPYKDVKEAAWFQGISEATLDRARKLVGIIVERDTSRRGRPSYWRLPDSPRT